MSAKILRPSGLHDTLLPMTGSSQAHPNRVLVLLHICGSLLFRRWQCGFV
jgi:hypothetical protein